MMFNPNVGGHVLSIVLQNDGRILIAGGFSTVGGVTRNNIARLNADGTLDTAFNPNANSDVYGIWQQPDGKLLLFGRFTTVSGVARKYLTRLNVNGTVDTGFNPPDANGFVRSLALQPDGKLVIGGEFTLMGGSPRNRVARLSSSGTLDDDFNPDADGIVNCLQLQPDGQVLIAGVFTNVGGAARNRIARLDANGTLDANFNPNASNDVYSLILQSDGKVLLGGSFTTVGGVVRNYIARLHANGAVDAGFNSDFILNTSAFSLALQPDGRVLTGGRRLSNDASAQTLSVTGSPSQIDWVRSGSAPEVEQVTFESWNGSAWVAQGIATRVAGGWRATGLALPTSSWIRARGRSVSSYFNGSSTVIEQIATYGAGNFPDITISEPSAGTLTDGISTVDFGGQNWLSPSPSKTFTIKNDGVGTLTGLAITIDGQNSADFTVSSLGTATLIGGASTTFTVIFTPKGGGGHLASLHIASNDVNEAPFDIQLSGNGIHQDATFTASASSNVYSSIAQSDGKVLLVGSFTMVNSVARNYVARLNADGTLDTSFNPSVGNIVHSVALQEDGKVLLGGWFTTVSGVARNYLARLNTDGTLDASFNANANGTVERIALQADGKVLLAGTFTTVGGISRNRVARVNADGTLDVNFSPGPNGAVSSICVQTDGKMLLGGDFTTMNAVNCRRVARLNSNGTIDASFGDPNVNGSVRILALSSDGKVIVGGTFTTVGGVSRNRLARLNSDGSLDTVFDPKMNDSVSSIALQVDGKIILGGSFTLADVAGRNYVARLNADGSLDNSFNPNPNRSVYGLALQTDGKVLLGGEFSLVGGVGRSNLARLPNNSAATQSLIMTGTSQIDWMRGNSAPEVEWVRFERWNGGTWVNLGSPTRQAGGWRVTGLALPMNSLVRAKGRAIGGYFNGSSTVVEQVTGPLLPEIVVEQPAGSILVDGTSNQDFGTEYVGGIGVPVNFTIRNIGPANLSGLALSKDGAHSGDFIHGTLSSTTLAPGESMTFTVAFTPTALGSRSAALHITSNDSDENPFDLTLSGVGTTSADIAVESPSGTDLIDSAATLDFGTLNTGFTIGKTVIIRNIGTSNLTNLALSISGANASEYKFSPLSATTLAQNGSMSFTLTFTPTGNSTRSATLQIASIDTDENPFDIELTGVGHVPQGPVFTVQPQSRLAFLGGPVSFDPIVTGDPVITYKWKKSTAFIPGATASSYTVLATKAADVGTYSVIADNPVGAEVLSSTAYLGLVTISHGMQTLKVGSTLKLTCTVAAPKLPGVSVKYDWFRQGSVDPITNGTKLNGAIVSGATTGALSIAKIGTADADIYTCLVTLDTPGNDPELNNGSTMVNVVDAVPDVAALPPDSVSVSEPIDITINATNSPTSFSATGLPAGLKFDTKTGRLTGKPTTPSKQTIGVYSPSIIKFKATNPFGTSGEENFLLTIEPLEPGVVGTFSGTVSRSGHTNFGMGGHVKITVASTGVVSGDVTLAGQKHSVVGSINVSLGNNPTFDLIVKRSPASLGDLRLTGNLSPPDDLLSGDISDPRFEMLTGTQDLGDPAEPGLVNGTMGEARFNHPSGLALLANGSGYISDIGDHVIRFVDGDGGTVSTFAGNTNSSSNDGTGTAAGFAGPEGLALDKAGNLFVADTLNATIRKITPAGVVTTFAGTAGQSGNTNGTGAAARFELPCALCFDPAGNLYVADRGNHTIRKITPAGVVTTLAGKADQSGHKDGSGASALFNTPRGIVYEPVLKALFVTDSENFVIRKVTLAGATTTYAGSPGAGGIADGLFANARFIDPRGITTLGDGTLIVTDILLVQLNPNGTLGTVSEFLDTASSLDHPVAVAYNPADESLVTLDPVFHGAISYEPSGVNQVAHFDARRNPWTPANFVPPAEQGLYNAALETTAEPTNGSFPHGDGYAQVAISKSGAATWTGKAADGTSFTFSTFIADDRSIPLHAMLYKNTGSLQGETFINSTTFDLIGDISPALDWYKLNQPLASKDRSYKDGFPVHDLTLSGGKYVPNDLHSYLGFDPTPSLVNMQLSFAESLITPFVQAFTLTKPNAVVVPSNAKSLTLKIDPKTGIFTGSFKEGTPAATVPFAGILIDYEAGGDKSGHGHYLIPESSSATATIHSSRVLLEAD